MNQKNLRLSIVVFVSLYRIVSSVGNGMSIVESSIFIFFPNDFSNFVGIFVSLQLHLSLSIFL
jgi:hypothetical protein